MNIITKFKQVILLMLWLICFKKINSEIIVSNVELMLSPYFEYEGNNPYFADNKLYFSALKSKYQTRNGHGWRNELKKRNELRKNLFETEEMLSSKVQINLSSGSKTIIVQYHDGSLGTIMKIFVADIFSKRLINGIAEDGIFDIYVTIKEIDGNENIFPMNVVNSNTLFDLKVENINGNIFVKINNVIIQKKAIDSENVYLKFGNYLQAQDSINGKQEEDKNKFNDFYLNHKITQDLIIFSEIEYTCK